MFAIIYRWRIKPGSETEFRRHWHEGTVLLCEKCGGLGSRLHRAPDGMMLAYARWPSKAARDKALREAPEDVRKTIRDMQALVTEALAQIELDIVDDLLLPEDATPSVG